MKKLDITLVLLFPITAALLSLSIKTNFLVSTIMFFGLLSIWLSYRIRDRIKKAALFSVIISIPFTIIFDYTASLDKSWFLQRTIFPFRLFSVIPVESFIWGFLLVYSVVIFYIHFLDKGEAVLLHHRMKYLMVLLVILLLIFFVALFIEPTLLHIKFAYFWLGLFFVLVPAICCLAMFPRLLPKFLKTGLYFFYLAMLFELTALQLDQWTFPGSNFIGWLELFGHRVPFEEFFFWFVMGAMGILSYYEFFDDDRK